MKKNGYTLIEILVVIAISLILAGAIFTLYNTIIKENISKSLIAKKESDAKIIIYQLLKDLEGIGFGVDNSRLKINGGNSSDLDNNNPFLTITNNGQTIIFLNLSARDEQYSGCWGYVKDDLSIDLSNSKSYLGNDCSGASSGNFIYLDENKNLLNSKTKGAVAFYIKDKNYPDDFKVKYYLDANNLPKECMPGTYSLYRQVNTDTAQPVASCIHTLKFRYGKTDGSYADSVNSINDLSSVIVCMLIQVGGKQSTQEPVPSFKTNRCNNITINETTDMRYYRWATIEEEVILKNIK